MPVEIVTTFDEAAAKLTRLSETIAVSIDPGLALASTAIRDATVEVIKAHTPVSEADTGEHLRDTTEGDILPDHLGTMITFRQTKTVPWERYGGQFPLARFLIDGTQAHTITATNAQALFWPGAAHPVQSVQHPGTSPNPYPEEAMAEAAPIIEPLLAGTGAGILRTAIAVLG